MHLHPMYYILFDFTSAILLENGYTSLYSSAVKLANGKSVLMMAPPNTGKSLTSIRLVNDFGASLIAEDVAITDGSHIWPVPYTDTYRNYGAVKKIANSRTCLNSEKIDFLFWLSKGKSEIKKLSAESVDNIQILNDYLLYYAKDPAIDAFNFFNNRFRNTTLLDAERNIITVLVNNVSAYYISDPDAMNFAQEIIQNTEQKREL